MPGLRAHGVQPDGGLMDSDQPVNDRLVVQLTRRGQDDLGYLIATEELNKTVIIHRALKLYRRVVESDQRGAEVQFVDGKQVTRLLIL